MYPFICTIMSHSSIVEVIGVSKYYSQHTALKNVTLTVPKGSIFGLLGPNGAGKTSLIRILTQITRPDEGRIIFDGQELKAAHIYEMGYLPEERGLYKKMPVGEQLLYFAQLKGLSTSEAKKRLKYWVDKFEIKSWLGKKVEELSKGMQQKVQFIASILHEPRLIILDEPFTGFDPQNAQLLVDEILLLREKGASIIFSTHRMDSVEKLCDEIALINKAEVVLSGHKDELKNRFKKNQFYIEYTGSLRSVNDVFEINEQLGEGKALVRILQSNNKAISAITQQVELNSFNEKLPEMEDIFIQAVKGVNTSSAS